MPGLAKRLGSIRPAYMYRADVKGDSCRIYQAVRKAVEIGQGLHRELIYEAQVNAHAGALISEHLTALWLFKSRQPKGAIKTS